MAVIYSQERAKYGNLTGQIIIWPVQYDGNPEDGANARNLPAGYLKCDGTKHFAEDYPRLAAILGVGENTKFIRRNIDGTAIDSVSDSQFMTPDLGSKYPEPTSGANAGLYNNIRLNNDLGTEISRSGIGIEAASAIGDNVRITYSGEISVPSQEISVRGRPSYTYAGATHYTETEGVEENALHPHTHFHSAVRARNRSTNEASSSEPLAQGQTGYVNASTIPIQDWLDATTNTSGIPGSGDMRCLAIDRWNPNSGIPAFSGQPVFGNALAQTIYHGGCIFGFGQQPNGGTNLYQYNCLNNNPFSVDRNTLEGSADNSNVAMFTNTFEINLGFFPVCFITENQNPAPDGSNDVPATYVQNGDGVPNDYNGNSIYDVVPLQSNFNYQDSRCTTDIENSVTDTVDLPREAGNDPTQHVHRIDLETNDHTYKVKTRAIVVPPENLVTTMDIGSDSSVSIDSACAPFIIMEYLIKI